MKKLLLLIVLLPLFGSSQNDYDRLIQKGKLHLQKKEFSLAKVNFESAIQLDKSIIIGYYYVGVVQAQMCKEYQANCKEAIEAFSIVIQKDSTYQSVFYNRGNCKNLILDFTGAIMDFNIAIQKDSTKPYYFMSRSFSYLQLGNIENACNDIKKAAKLGSPTAQKQFSLRNCH